MNTKHRFPPPFPCLFAAGLLALASASSALQAQPSPMVNSAALEPGSVEGTLTPSAGSPKSVEGVTIAVAETGEKVLVDRHGRYSFNRLKPGTYTLTASGPGFSRLRITDVVVRPGRLMTLGVQEMPLVMRDGEAQLMQEVVVSARKTADTLELEKYVVEETKQKPFTDSNTDKPRTVDDAQPYYIFNSRTIEQSGAINVEDFLRQRLTMTTSSVSNNQKATYNSPNGTRSTSNISLRGLSSAQTLILINGRRAAGGGGGPNTYQTDLNGIPVAAIDRIEVLPSSASGIYGGGAVGGVINVITKRAYAGGEVRLTYGNTFDTDSSYRNVDVTYGFPLENGRTQVMLTGRYAKNGSLQFRDREFLKEYFARAITNNPTPFTTTTSGYLYFGNPSGLIIAQAGNLAGTTSTFITIPNGYTGVATAGLPALLAGAGQLKIDFPDNYQPANGLRQDLYGATTTKSLMAQVRRQMTPWLEVFVDASYADNYGLTYWSTYAGGGTVPATAPTNPFGQAVYVGWSPNAIAPQSSHNYTRGVSSGFKMKLPKDWVATGDYTWSSANSSGLYSTADVPTINAALASGAINPFRDLRLNPVDGNRYLLNSTSQKPSGANIVGLRAAGPIWSLPGGPVNLVAAGERRQEGNSGGFDYTKNGLETLTTAVWYFGQSQVTTSGYAELNVPIIGPRNSLPGIRQLEFQMAGRKEWYGVKTTRQLISSATFFQTVVSGAPNAVAMSTVHGIAHYDSANPTLGVLYKPVDDVIIRASTAEAFVPPTYVQLQPAILSTTQSTVVDPRRGNTTTSVYTLSGGNVDLTPEHSRSQSVGVVLTPKAVKNLRLSLDYTWIRKLNNIGSLAAQVLVSNESYFPDRVVRGPVPANDPYGVGPITQVNTYTMNLYKTVLEAYDATVSYRFDTSDRGSLTVSALGTWQTHYLQKASLNTPMLEYAGSPNAASNTAPLDFRGTLNLNWEHNRWQAGWSTSYYSSYAQLGPPLTTVTNYLTQQGNSPLDSQMTHDVFVGYRSPRAINSGASWRGRLLEGLDIQVGVKNVFNARPIFDGYAQPTFFASSFVGLRMAEYYVSMKKAF